MKRFNQICFGKWFALSTRIMGVCGMSRRLTRDLLPSGTLRMEPGKARYMGQVECCLIYGM